MKKTRATQGFTLVDILFAMGIVAIAFLGLFSAIVHTTRTNSENRETTQAARAAEQVVETLQSGLFTEIFRTYNRTTLDDVGPSPYGAAPLGSFEVLSDGRILFGPIPAGERPMFQPLTGDADGRVGRIDFPEQPFGTLDENQCIPMGFTGIQGDLNGNGVATDADVSASYLMLPVIISIEFRGQGGSERRIRFHKVLTVR